MIGTEEFYGYIKKEIGVILATAAGSSVSMRIISPVYYNGDILMFTFSDSRKYRQMKENPNCCISVGEFFAETKAEFCGSTMLDENKAMREAYIEKFPDAFDDNVEFGGKNCEFILLHPTRLSGWTFASEAPVAGDVPTVPFEIVID